MQGPGAAFSSRKDARVAVFVLPTLLLGRRTELHAHGGPGVAAPLAVNYGALAAANVLRPHRLVPQEKARLGGDGERHRVTVARRDHDAISRDALDHPHRPVALLVRDGGSGGDGSDEGDDLRLELHDPVLSMGMRAVAGLPHRRLLAAQER